MYDCDYCKHNHDLDVETSYEHTYCQKRHCVYCTSYQEELCKDFEKEMEDEETK